MQHNRLTFPLYIMSGGKSSRFGQDKARALLHDKPLVLHVAETFARLASTVVVVADRADKYAELGLTTIPDLTPHLGPLGGLQTALTHLQRTTSLPTHQELTEQTGRGWCLVVSCDMVGLREEWVEDLWSHQTPDTQALAFGPQPWDSMFALYRSDLLPEVTRRVEQGQRAMWRLLQDVGTAVPHPPDWHQVVSINAPEDLERLDAT